MSAPHNSTDTEERNDVWTPVDMAATDPQPDKTLYFMEAVQLHFTMKATDDDPQTRVHVDGVERRVGKAHHFDGETTWPEGVIRAIIRATVAEFSSYNQDGRLGVCIARSRLAHQDDTHVWSDWPDVQTRLQELIDECTVPLVPASPQPHC